MLDKFILDEKAELLKYWKPSEEEKLKYPTQDYTNDSLQWSGRLLKGYDPLTPSKNILI